MGKEQVSKEQADVTATNSYIDEFSEHALHVRRNLLLTATSSLLFTIFGLDIDNEKFWGPIKGISTELAHTLLLILSVYYLIYFSILTQSHLSKNQLSEISTTSIKLEDMMRTVVSYSQNLKKYIQVLENRRTSAHQHLRKILGLSSSSPEVQDFITKLHHQTSSHRRLNHTDLENAISELSSSPHVDFTSLDNMANQLRDAVDLFNSFIKRLNTMSRRKVFFDEHIPFSMGLAAIVFLIPKVWPSVAGYIAGLFQYIVGLFQPACHAINHTFA